MYKQVKENDLNKTFRVEKEGHLLKLSINKQTKPIFIKSPFFFDENVASLVGLTPDGSLIKDLMRIYFTQKKDLSKIKLFEQSTKKLFSNDILFFRKIDNSGSTQTYVNSKTLAWFFYYILGVPKSDELMRVPRWVFQSSYSVKIAYLQQAFDMEATISKRLHEIRFGSKSGPFVKDIKNLLASIGIKSHVTYAPRIKQSSGQYRVSIYGKDNFKKFKEIGFRIPFLKTRFSDLLTKYDI